MRLPTSLQSKLALKMTRMNKLALLATLAVMGIPVYALQRCKQMSFTGTVLSTEGYSHSLAPNLKFRLAPLKNNWGWIISINPQGSDEDWSYPVTFPIRSGEGQLIGTGYGSTVQERVTSPTAVRFVLTQSDYAQYSQMAEEVLSSSPPQKTSSPPPVNTEEFIKKVGQLKKGLLIVKAIKYGKGDSKETIKWMSFKATVVVPMSFPSPHLRWAAVSCPASQ